jgi:2-polyprenyl-6-hydroxyphenyl methylase/3-demethylubiquinone-9 3-methyltransferase
MAHSKFFTQINPVRMEYIVSILGAENIKNMKILDLGCGGGLMSFPLANLGAKVDAIDASEENIEAAKLYAKNQKSKVNFIHSSVEEHKGLYDAIICLELIEHVDNLDEFIMNLSKLLKPKGKVIFSTINRNLKAYFLAKTMAEYVLNWVPRNTHNFKKFVKPSELADLCEVNNITISDITGMSYNLIGKSWKLSRMLM